MSIPKLDAATLFKAIAHLYRTTSPQFTKHALMRMAERNIHESQIEYIITNAVTLINEPRYNEFYESWAYRVDAKTGISVVITFHKTKKGHTIKIITVMHNTLEDIDNEW